MDADLVEHVVGRVRTNIRILDEEVRATGGGSQRDLCDIGVARSFTSELRANGSTPEQLISASEVLLQASDIMSFHRTRMQFEQTVDRLSWSYAGLYLRLLALALSEEWPAANDIPPAGSTPSSIDEKGPPAMAAIANTIHADAVDRLAQALDRCLELVPSMLEGSPHGDESAATIARLDRE